jgi:hypothetical protein
MQMNWRLLTVINAAIALITLSSVIYVVSRPRVERTRAAAVRSVPTNEQKQAADREAKARVEALDDLSQARVDDLGAVPAAELTHLMDRATPDQLAALALKFNEAPTDARTLGGMGMFFQAWAQLDPKASLTGALQLQDVTMKKLAVTTVVNSVSPSAASELIAQLTEHPDKDLLSESKNEFLNALVTSWSSLDPEAASKFVDDLGDTKTSLNQTARNNIAYNWGTLDPNAALEWVRKQDTDYFDVSYLYNQVIKGWSFKDIATASAYVAQHLDDPAADRAAATVAEAMFARNPDNATAWITQMPQGSPRSEAELTIANTWSEKDPVSASHWMATLPTDDQNDIVGRIATHWANNDWPEASRWIETLNGEVRDRALSAAMNRDNATENDSLTLALSIRNDELRHDRIEGVIRNWSYSDAQAAEAWVNNSSLSPEERDHLRSVISETQQQATEATSERVIIEH